MPFDEGNSGSAAATAESPLAGQVAWTSETALEASQGAIRRSRKLVSDSRAAITASNELMDAFYRKGRWPRG